MQKLQHYVMFPNHDNAMRLYRELKNLGVRATIAPTPRVLSTCCGVSLLAEEKDISAIRACVEEHGIEILKIEAIESDINPRRDKYC